MHTQEKVKRHKAIPQNEVRERRLLYAFHRAEQSERFLQARRILGISGILLNPFECLGFLEHLRSQGVSCENPYWIAADKVCSSYLERLENSHEAGSSEAEGFMNRYRILFRNSGKGERITPVSRRGEDFKGEFDERGGSGGHHYKIRW